MNDKLNENLPSPKQPLREDPCTPEYYEFLRSQGYSEEKISHTGTRLRTSFLETNLTEYFIHEAKMHYLDSKIFWMMMVIH
jgi:hypothetical protein